MQRALIYMLEDDGYLPEKLGFFLNEIKKDFKLEKIEFEVGKVTFFFGEAGFVDIRFVSDDYVEVVVFGASLENKADSIFFSLKPEQLTGVTLTYEGTVIYSSVKFVDLLSREDAVIERVVYRYRTRELGIAFRIKNSPFFLNIEINFDDEGHDRCSLLFVSLESLSLLA